MMFVTMLMSECETTVKLPKGSVQVYTKLKSIIFDRFIKFMHVHTFKK